MEFKNKTKAEILEYVENCVIHYMNYEKLPESMKKYTKELVDKLWAKQLIDVPIMSELLIEEDAWVRDAMNTVKGKEIQKVILTILVEKEWAEKQRRQVDGNGVKLKVYNPHSKIGRKGLRFLKYEHVVSSSDVFTFKVTFRVTDPRTEISLVERNNIITLE